MLTTLFVDHVDQAQLSKPDQSASVRRSWTFILARCVEAVKLKQKMPKNMISTHVLDTSNGGPGCGIVVSLHKLVNDEDWQIINKSITDMDGRAVSFITEELFTTGIYKFVFATGDYFQSMDQPCIFPIVEVTFKCETGQHYHIPVLINRYSFTTYRGK